MTIASEAPSPARGLAIFIASNEEPHPRGLVNRDNVFAVDLATLRTVRVTGDQVAHGVAYAGGRLFVSTARRGRWRQRMPAAAGRGPNVVPRRHGVGVRPTGWSSSAPRARTLTRPSTRWPFSTSRRAR